MMTSFPIWSRRDAESSRLIFLGSGNQTSRRGRPTVSRSSPRTCTQSLTFFALKPFIPVVHDSSGPTGVNYVLDNPDRVVSLVVLNSPYGEAPTRRWPEFVEIFTTKTLGALALAIAQSPAQFGWMLNWQRQQFSLHLPESQREHFEKFMGPLIENNFTQQPGAGIAFVQMTAELDAKIALDTDRYPQLEALSLPVTILWGKHDPYLNSGMAEELNLIFRMRALILWTRDTGCSPTRRRKSPD